MHFPGDAILEHLNAVKGPSVFCTCFLGVLVSLLILLSYHFVPVIISRDVLFTVIWCNMDRVKLQNICITIAPRQLLRGQYMIFGLASLWCTVRVH